MPRPSKEFHFLTSDVSDETLEEPDIQKTMLVFEQLLSQFERTRHSDRKRKYRHQLANVFKHLCVTAHKVPALEKRVATAEASLTRVQRVAEEVPELKKELRKTNVDLARKQRVVEKYQDDSVRLEMKVQSGLEYKARYEAQRKMNRSQDTEYAQLLREYEALESKLETAKKRLAKKHAK